MRRDIFSPTTTTFLTRLAIGAGLVASLAACGGGSSTDSVTAASVATGALQTAASTTTGTAANATATWNNCAVEGATCSFSGTQEVRYGTNGTYFYKTLTGPVACTNEVFGDPLPGGDKSCAIPAAAAPAAPAPASWTTCADEGGTCSFTGSKQVRYGAPGLYAYKTVTGPVACNNTVFGDPAPGADKTCAVSGSTGTTPAPTPTPTPTPAPTPTPPPVAAPTDVLPMPTNIANGATVSLQCGKTYQGTLELNGKQNVTVNTAGTCGKAAISPGRAVTGFTKYSGNIYSAPISFTPVQVAVAGNPVSAAHWPNTPWATSTGSIPNSDLNGATLHYQENQSVIKSQKLTSNSVSTSKPFYVEGKLWMLDTANEWAVQNGRLYVWTQDGQSPEGKVWAATNSNGINADNSTNITINGIKIFSANNAISANTSNGLKVLNTDIANSYTNGIWASGSQKMTVDKTTVLNSREGGINGWYWIVNAVITNSTITNTGTVAGMPSTTDAGLFLGDGQDNYIDNVRVLNSGYHGISVLHNRRTKLLNSVVDTACVKLTDCAGIYTGAVDKLPLTLLIEGNTVTNVKGTEGIAIYLDDSANGVTVNRNTVSNSTRGMVLHNAFDNVITNNTISASAITHLAFGQNSGHTIRNNKVTNNTFKTTGTEQTYNMETGSNLKTFATFDYNTYTSNNVNMFGRTWDGSSAGVNHSYTAWKAWSGQDKNSTMNGRP